MRFVLGLDCSTTAAKAVLLDENGNTFASRAVEYALSSPWPLWAEQDPRDWWMAGATAIRMLLRETAVAGQDVAAVGLTGHMFGLVALDAAGEPVRPCIMWNDQRSGRQCEYITELLGLERLISLTANAMLPGYVAPKLLWVREHEPEVYAAIRKLLVAKDYVRYRLTGEFATDVTDAAGFALFDVARRRWSDEMAQALHVPPEWLPPVYESQEVTGVVSSLAAAETGLATGTPVIAGAGDQPAQAVGCGIVEPGLVSVTTGTSGVVFAAANRPVIHSAGQLHAFCHAAPGTWCLMGVVLSAGGSLRWYRDVMGQAEKTIAGLAGRDPYELLMEEAGQAPPGSEGLLFLPYLNGERTPYVDPQARGGWIGLTARHDRRHMVRSVVEGVTFALRDALEMVQAQEVDVRQVYASGGGARSPLWRQIQADVLGRELVTVCEGEGAALGAAILAAVGAGRFPSVAAACRQLVGVASVTQPVVENVLHYDDLYAVYRGLYAALKPTNDRLSALAQGR